MPFPAFERDTDWITHRLTGLFQIFLKGLKARRWKEGHDPNFFWKGGGGHRCVSSLSFWFSRNKIALFIETTSNFDIGNSLDRTPNFCQNLVIFRSKNMYLKGISHPVFYGDLVYKLRRVKDTPNFISSGSKIVKRLRRRQYDPLIIETTIGLVLGPCTALCRLFPKALHSLTNKAVGTIWRALSKPPQRRQGPDLRPLWLLVGTPSAIRPELAFSRAEHSLPYSDVTIYIFAILYLSSMPYV